MSSSHSSINDILAFYKIQVYVNFSFEFTFTQWSSGMAKSNGQQFLLVNWVVLSSHFNWVINFYLKVPENCMHFIFNDIILSVHLPLVSMLKLHSLAHILGTTFPTQSCLFLFSFVLAAFTYYVSKCLLWCKPSDASSSTISVKVCWFCLLCNLLFHFFLLFFFCSCENFLL